MFKDLKYLILYVMLIFLAVCFMDNKAREETTDDVIIRPIYDHSNAIVIPK